MPLNLCSYCAIPDSPVQQGSTELSAVLHLGCLPCAQWLPSCVGCSVGPGSIAPHCPDRLLPHKQLLPLRMTPHLQPILNNGVPPHSSAMPSILIPHVYCCITLSLYCISWALNTMMFCVPVQHQVVAVLCLVHAKHYAVLCSSVASSRSCGVCCASNLVLQLYSTAMVSVLS